ncbi:MAG: CBS domain-containing protein [Alphaproteobacteria bacterium]|nr:CBS domain-containing protein [Alphaproteobacteria bacterium]
MSSKCSCLKSFLNRIFRKKSKELNVRNAIEEIIEEEEDEPSQSIANDEREMIGNVLDLRDIQVQDIMIPKVSIVSVSTTASIEEIINKFVENNLTKLLVYQWNNDNIVGALHLKDIASWLNSYTNKYDMDNTTNINKCETNISNKLNTINLNNDNNNTMNISNSDITLDHGKNINSAITIIKNDTTVNNNTDLQNINNKKPTSNVNATGNDIDTHDISNKSEVNNEISANKDDINTNNIKNLQHVNIEQESTNIVNVHDRTSETNNISEDIKQIQARNDNDNISKHFNVNLYMKEVLFVPPTMKTLDLLFQMKQTGNKIAVVIDEYGCVSGLISFMDLMEEIVGDIKDAAEIKQQKNKIIISNDGSILTDGKSTFYEIEKYGNLKITPPDDLNDTIGGMITSTIGRVPVKGELISFPKQSLAFEIVDADTRRIKKIKIRTNM